jgi:stage V sporulation protein S
VAGAISKRIREGSAVKVVALGALSVNQSVKSMAISRSFLEADGIDLAVQPEFIHIPSASSSDEPQRSALRFNIVPRPPASGRTAPRTRGTSDPGASELKVASKTSPMSAAGAIAKRVREGKKCVVVAMGADSVNQAVKAVAIARTYLEDDQMDINFRPKFIHVEMGQDANAEVKSAIELNILVNQL